MCCCGSSKKKEYENVTDIQGVTDEEAFSKRPPFSFKTLWKFTGPGWLMSIAYLDPGNIEADLQAGATTGYSLLWVLFWSTVMGLLLQLLAARLGVVTGKNLAQICRRNYAPVPRYVIWLMTEMAIIGSDIQEVIGSAIAFHALSLGYIPIWVGVIITVCDTFLFLLLERKGIRILEIFFCILIGIMAVTFGIEYGISEPDFIGVLKGIAIPSIPKGATVQAVGILGAVIMPHNIYLHSALVQSRNIDRKQSGKVKEANFYNALESGIALFVSFIINAFVVSVFAQTFWTESSPASDIGLQNAGDKLKDVYGWPAYYIWAIGLLAAGQSSTMTGTYTGQFVMEGFIEFKTKIWVRVLVTRSIAIVPALLVAVLAQSGLDTLDQWLNVLQYIQLPFALVPVLVFTSQRRIMGSFKNAAFVQIFCWILAMFVIATNFYLVVEVVLGLPDEFQHLWLYITLGVVGAIYVVFILYLSCAPFCCKYEEVDPSPEEEQGEDRKLVN
eukprot:TRINITY_DN7335_c0_g1_i1.p1 TRINITY_DN7335_c0_g1~~TRINITY_DN7335_c0_g1_i1.p1  ORF type:complete len:500 (-),score=85.26 TRINITY_DN7335_c0_g1_i1:104-1603(-)